MGKVTIKRYLGRQYRRFLIGSVLVFPLVAVVMGFAIWARSRGSLTAALLVVGYLIALGFAVWRLLTMDRHPDLVRLSRYGPLAELLPSIEAELADPGQVAKVGRMMRSFQLTTETGGDLGHDEVWFTPSWLINVTGQGTRMRFFALDSLVLVARVGNSVLLADDCDERVEIPGTPAGATRLLAEILARVPWVLNRFDADTEKSWTENRQEIVAEVSRRREQIKASRPGSAVQAPREGVAIKDAGRPSQGPGTPSCET
jgi:hypothetical protein